MKKTKLLIAVLLVVCMVGALALVACNNTKTYTVTWRNGKNYSFTNESGELLDGEQTVDEGTELKFKVVPSNTLTTVTKVTAGDDELVAENGVYTVIVNADVTISAAATTLDNDVQSIAITTQPTKTIYNVGESFDKTGMVVTATLRDSSTSVVSNYKVIYQNGGSAFQAGDTKVTISYTDSYNVTKTADVAVTVNNAELERIEKSGALTVTEYVEGSTLTNINGLTVTAYYSDESSRVLNFNELTVVYEQDGAESFTMGDTKVTLQFGDKEVEVAITVRAWKAFNTETISVEMKMAEGKPVLEITGEVVDATQVAFTFTDDVNTAFTPVAGTITNNNFVVTVALDTALANAVAAKWNDCKLYYANEAGSYIDLNKSQCVNYDQHLYYQGRDYHFQNWEGALKVEFTTYEVRNVVANVEKQGEAINLTISGDLGTATALKLMIGQWPIADVTLNTENYTFSVTVDLVALVAEYNEYIQPNTVYEIKIGNNSVPALAEQLYEEIDDYAYTTENASGNLALKLVPLGLATQATIALNDSKAELVITGETEATAVKVRLGAVEVDATVDGGKYTAKFDLKELLIVGYAYNVEINEDNAGWNALVYADVEASGTADYRLTNYARGSDIYAKNLYEFVNNNGKLAVSYSQSSYKADGDVLVAHILGIGFQNSKFAFVYENNKNVWGALKKGDWLWFEDDVDYGTNAKIRFAPKDADLSKFKYGSWTISYTTGDLNDMDNEVFLAYDGTQTSFVAVEGILGFEVQNGHIYVVKKVSDYTATVRLLQYANGKVYVEVSGQFTPALADRTGYGVHCWYEASIDFEGEIDRDGSFTYTYTFETVKEGKTMYLHMMNAGDEVNLNATISGEASLTANGFTYTLNRSSSGEITLVVTAAA